MDLDRYFLSVLIKTKLDGFRQASKSSVTDALLQNEEKKIFSFISEYVKEYSNFPSTDVLQSKFGFEPEDYEADLPFLIDELYKRKMTESLVETINKSTSALRSNDPRKAMESLKDQIRQIERECNYKDQKSETMGDLGSQVLDLHDKIKNGYTGLLTPWETVNKATLGFWEQDLILFAARLNLGKSWVCTILAHHLYTTTKHKLIFATTEMSRLKIAMRFYSLATKTPFNDVTHGLMNPYMKEHMLKVRDSIKQDDRLHVLGGDFDFSLGPLEAYIDEIQPRAIIFDGGYLLKVPGFDRRERAANAFDELKRLANTRHITVIVTHQFNRDAKANQKDSLNAASLAMTDVAGWNADGIYALHQTDDMKVDARMSLVPLKTREGVSEETLINWNFNKMDFSEIPLVKDGGGGGESDEFGTGIDVQDPDVDLPF